MLSLHAPTSDYESTLRKEERFRLPQMAIGPRQAIRAGRQKGLEVGRFNRGTPTVYLPGIVIDFIWTKLSLDRLPFLPYLSLLDLYTDFLWHPRQSEQTLQCFLKVKLKQSALHFL